jgi:hypothetical protein
LLIVLYHLWVSLEPISIRTPTTILIRRPLLGDHWAVRISSFYPRRLGFPSRIAHLGNAGAGIEMSGSAGPTLLALRMRQTRTSSAPAHEWLFGVCPAETSRYNRRSTTAFLIKERVIAKQQNTIAKKMREQDQKQKSNEKRLKRQIRKDFKAAQSA